MNVKRPKRSILNQYFAELPHFDIFEVALSYDTIICKLKCTDHQPLYVIMSYTTKTQEAWEKLHS